MHTLRIIAAIVFSLCVTAAAAHSFNKGDITVGHPWTRATPGVAVGVGYLTITNKGKVADKLMGGTFDGAESVEVHEMKMEGDMMKMRALPDGLEIPAGATVELKPGSYHLMLMGMQKPIVQGPDIKGTLTFEKAGTVDVEYRVEPIGAASSTDHHHD
jgi:periplasmic copper chaperone A